MEGRDSIYAPSIYCMMDYLILILDPCSIIYKILVLFWLIFELINKCIISPLRETIKKYVGKIWMILSKLMISKIQSIISCLKKLLVFLGIISLSIVKWGPSGLININDSCYMNSLIQALASSPKTVKEFQNLKNQFNNQKINILLDLLKKLNDPRSRSNDNTQILRSLVKEIKWIKPEQQDAFDFLSFIINSIQREIKKNENDIKMPLKIKLIHKYNGMNIEDKLQDHLGLSLGLCGDYAKYPGVSITDLIDEHFSPTNIDDDESKSTQMMMYGNPPDVLLLHIQANKWDHRQGRMIKPVYHIIYDFNMKLNLTIERDSVKQSSSKESVTYQLMAIVNHMGIVSGGHYITYRKLGSRWYLVNDEQVEEIKQFQCNICPYLLIYEKDDFAIIPMGSMLK